MDQEGTYCHTITLSHYHSVTDITLSHYHIITQSLNHRHKNHYSNLVILCKKCHQDVHKNKIEIKGYKETTDGIKLDYTIKKRTRKTYNQNY